METLIPKTKNEAFAQLDEMLSENAVKGLVPGIFQTNGIVINYR